MGLLNKFLNLTPQIRVALIVAPLLGVGGFILMDYYEESEVPDQQVYRLVPDIECRLIQAPCTFSALGVTATLEARNTNEGGTVISVKTSMSVKKVMLEASGSLPHKPMGMRSLDTKSWEQELPAALSSYDALHVVFASRRAFLFLDTDIQ